MENQGDFVDPNARRVPLYVIAFGGLVGMCALVRLVLLAVTSWLD